MATKIKIKYVSKTNLKKMLKNKDFLKVWYLSFTHSNLNEKGNKIKNVNTTPIIYAIIYKLTVPRFINGLNDSYPKVIT